MRRPLAETLCELAVAAALPAARAGMQITSLGIDLPLEVRLRRGADADEWELLADLPTWRWQTGLEELRSRLQIKWGNGGAS